MRRSFFFVSLFLLSGCSSVQWTDGRGITHHRGLVAVRLATGDLGSRIDRYALGVDINLNGAQKGISVGGQHTALDAAHIINIDKPAELPNSIAAHLTRINIKPIKRDVVWHWFWVDENVTAASTYIRKESAGLDFASRDKQARLVAGYSAEYGPTGIGLKNNIAQIRTFPLGKPEHWELVLWKLDPSIYNN